MTGCWPCDAAGWRGNPLLERARRLAGATDLDVLADEIGNLGRAWVDGLLAAEDRRSLLGVWRRRHHELLDMAIVTPTREDPRRPLVGDKLEAKGTFKVAAGAQVLAEVSLNGKPTVAARFTLK